ncbi:MAG: HAMP domain-containing histidine kinase [Myxococcales bacterium]|nr:HAMP domain-containing histidine kinase [Myxococcales bacterium]
MATRPFSPPIVELRAAHVLLFAAVAVPGLLLTATGIVSLALHRFTADVVLGILTLAFALWVIVGGFATWLLVRRSERKTRLQHDFVSNVSHELRTPLTGIRVLVETLQLGRVDPVETKACLDLLETQTTRLAGLVEEVLLFGRLQSGARQVSLATESLDEIVEIALGEFEALRLSGSIQVVRDLPPGLRVQADRRALVEILVNLLSNALKYGGENKTVWVRALREERMVAISVEDEGPGVPTALRRKIFQDFFRGEDERTQSKPGTGLGLAIAQRLVVAQKGKIRVEPRPGGGSRFVFTVPATEGAPSLATGPLPERVTPP